MQKARSLLAGNGASRIHLETTSPLDPRVRQTVPARNIKTKAARWKASLSLRWSRHIADRILTKTKRFFHKVPASREQPLGRPQSFTQTFLIEESAQNGAGPWSINGRLDTACPLNLVDLELIQHLGVTYQIFSTRLPLLETINSETVYFIGCVDLRWALYNSQTGDGPERFISSTFFIPETSQPIGLLLGSHTMKECHMVSIHQPSDPLFHPTGFPAFRLKLPDKAGAAELAAAEQLRREKRQALEALGGQLQRQSSPNPNGVSSSSNQITSSSNINSSNAR